MYSPIQLDIIRTFGSKELSEGCIFSYKYLDEVWIDKGIWFTEDSFPIRLENYRWITWSWKHKILWHIPELFPDVARVTKEKGMKVSYLGNLMINTNKVIKRTNTSIEFETFNIPYNPTLPLINQEESTLVQLLNLFKP